MKINKAVTEAVLNYVYLTFEKKHLNLGEFKVLIIASNILRKDIPEFICNNKINYQRLEEEMAASDNFFFELSSNLLPYLLPEQKTMLQDIMKKFGYILGVNKRFRKAKKMALVDYGEEKTVRKIEIYKDAERNRFRVAINNILIPWQIPKGNTDKHYWEYIYEIAERVESEAIDAKRAKGVQQWFNSRKDNPMYKYTGIKPSRILEYRSEFFYPAPRITIKKMSQKKAYS